MKKIILPKHQVIHLDNIQHNNIIIGLVKGELYCTIMHNADGWYGITKNGNFNYWEKLSELFSDSLISCCDEFLALE